MIYRNIIIPLVCLYILNLQITSGQQNYLSYSPSDKFAAFTENFDNNSNQWIEENLWITSTVNFGYYTIRCNNYHMETGLSSKPLPVNLSKDFEIETAIKIVKGSGALVFGMNSKFDHYRIEVNDKSKVIFLKDVPSRKRVDKLLTDPGNSNIKQETYNKLTIRKVNDIYYLFINDVFIKQFTGILIEGDQVGYNVGLDSEISVDYLKISYLKTGDAPLYAEEIFLNGSQGSAKQGQGPVQSGGSPVITWVNPIEKTTPLETFTSGIKANIRSNSGLKSVLLYLNGVAKGECTVKTIAGQAGNFMIEKTVNFGPDENSIYLLATNNEGATKSEVRFFNNPAAIPPEINWGKPVIPNTVVKTSSYIIESRIKSPTDLKSAKIIVNGDIQFEDNVFQASTGNVDYNYVWKRPVILREGDNDIFIVATNAAGSSTSEKRTLNLQPGLAERRLALVIGNSEYGTKTSLINPVNDANLIEGSLKELGFDVIKKLDATYKEMNEAIRTFSQNLPEYNVALFYYAGHGIQVDGVNYLIPTDAKLKEKTDCKYEAVRVDFVVSEFEKYPENTNIVILDACRDNPFAAWERGGESGFKAMNFTSGTIISFATSEGSTAADGGGNGLFTEELVKQMALPQPIESVFKKTRVEVKNRSNGKQTPQEWSKLNGDFYFKK